ncbi:hypothetical protein PC128_g10869 [Phytophthora cactorum]|nr:hypothetical protein PC120_g24796 [Phytophthora cactorum]KAG3089551.1 hypothetical protein PC121_g4298 [Phytophthora cactorum]KAG3191543.1 hypothetical protein PC128_g10869 [Phytophthora cactorum]
MPRGQYRIDQAKVYSELAALSWMDSRPVNMLSTGCSTEPTVVNRREENGSITVSPCPHEVVDYANGMGFYDQLRLHHYLIQNCINLTKY